MHFDFDLGAIAHIEFGIELIDTDAAATFLIVSTDRAVRNVLIDMVVATHAQLESVDEGPSPYSPSNMHTATEYLAMPLSSPMAQKIRKLHHAVNIGSAVGALDDPAKIGHPRVS